MERLRQAAFSTALVPLLRETVRSETAPEQERRSARRLQLARQLTDIDSQEARLVDANTSRKLKEPVYKRQQKRLDSDRCAASSELEQIDLEPDLVDVETDAVLDALKRPDRVWKELPVESRLAFQRLVFPSD